MDNESKGADRSALFSDLPGDEGLAGRDRPFAMIAVMAGTTMAVFDGTLVNIALPQIARALHVTAGAAIWVSNGYLLSAAMTLAIFAALANRLGFRALYAAGLSMFTLASLGCALSTSLDVLTAMRVLQGIGGAAMLSIAPAIHRAVFPNRVLGRILGLHALLIATCTAVAPLLGGTLLAAWSWPWLFAINIPVGALGVVLALRAIPGARTAARAPFDVAGALLSAVGMGALILAADACSRARSDGALAAWPAVAGYGAIAVAAGWAFVRRQRRAQEPLLPLDMFSSRRFSLAALTSLASFVGQGIAFVALPFLFQSAYGYTPFVSALLFTPWPIGIVLAAPHAGRLADRHSPAVLSTLGLGVFTLGLALLALLPGHATAWDICWRALVCGAGFGFFQSPNNREMLSTVPRHQGASASAVLAIARTFGQCLGAVIVGIVLSRFTGTGGGGATAALGTEASTFANAAQDFHAVGVALWMAVGATGLAIAVSVGRLRQARGG